MLDIEYHFYKRLYVAQSSLSGDGLFSDELIKKGDTILRFGGTIALQKERHSGKYLESTFISISEECILCEMQSSDKDPSDFINHSCSPNAGMRDSITLVAIRDIQKGEEILCDYAFWEGDESYIMKEPCRCGNQNCRRTITGKDWKLFSESDDFFHFFSPFIRKRILEKKLRRIV